MKDSMIIHPEELSKSWIDRLSNAGVPILGIHPVGGKSAVNSLTELVEIMKTSEYRELIDYAKAKGLEVEYEVHSAGYLLPRELFFVHPEYFREDEKGERVNDFNFCVSNSEALDIFAKRFAELAKDLYGSRHDFYFWMDDGRGLQCHCEKCRNLSPSDQQLIALNQAIKEIRKYIPDARIAYLAYCDSIIPPAKVNAEGGIFLEYAPFEKYVAKGDDAAERIKHEKEMLIPLMSFFGGEPCKVLEYWYDNSLFSGWKKPPKKFVLNCAGMRADIEEYHSMGFSTVSTFACFLGQDYEELYGEVDVKPFAECI